jgi:hypothetical protein
MSPSWRRLARVAVVFAAVGWLVAVSIGATEADVSWRQALTDPVHLRALLVGLLATVVWGPVWVSGRPPLWLGPVLGLVAGVCSVYLYFFAFPHEWQGSRPMAWKSTKVVVGTYYRWLVPYFLLGGAACSWWVGRPVAAKGWEKLAEDGDEQATAAVASEPVQPAEGATAQLPVVPSPEADTPTRPVPLPTVDRLREGATVPLPAETAPEGTEPTEDEGPAEDERPEPEDNTEGVTEQLSALDSRPG